MRRTEGNFRGHKSADLFYQTWESDNPCGTLVVTHGISEHSECYNRFAWGIEKSNWNVFGWDLRGHGRSEGRRGYVEHFSDYTYDLLCFLEEVRRHPKAKDKPIILLGHSLGGLINIRTLIDNGDMGLEAACFSSPLLGIAVNISKVKDAAARLLSRWVPKLTLGNDIVFEQVTRDRAISRTYEVDPLRHEKASPNLYLGMIENCEFAMANAQKILLPVYMQLAGTDYITSLEAAEEFFSRIGSKNKQKIVYKDSYHEIFNDINREEVYADFMRFLDKVSEKNKEMVNPPY